MTWELGGGTFSEEGRCFLGKVGCLSAIDLFLFGGGEKMKEKIRWSCWSGLQYKVELHTCQVSKP
jgi:hypothetical protein